MGSLTREELLRKLAKVKLLTLDFDGTLTDGFVYFGEDGYEFVRCSRKDSLGIELIREAEVEVVVLSKEANSIVATRCKKMGIECVQAIKDGEGKREILAREMKKRGLVPERVAYMGDDVNDLEPLEFAGLSITVADGDDSLKEKADFVTSRRGGEHAVREVCDLILESRKG
ncbi:MAG: HAD hydrolase family protein [Patescibacteria group bacterium]|nr:HAD hydrolase family protein [Patescibacteria group bacterium]